MSDISITPYVDLKGNRISTGQKLIFGGYVKIMMREQSRYYLRDIESGLETDLPSSIGYDISLLAEIYKEPQKPSEEIKENPSNKIEIEITPIEMFEVKVNGVSAGYFKEESSWEGFIKLSNELGKIIAIDNRTYVDNVFAMLGSQPEKNKFEVIKMSPDIIPDGALNNNEN